MITTGSVAVSRFVTQFLLVSCVFGIVASCGAQQKGDQHMELKDSLAFVRNDRIKFVTMSSGDSPFTTLGRRVVIVDPPEVVELSRTGDVRILDELVALLKDRDRAWAAMVLLAALTRREEDVVNAFATSQDKWWESVGKTAYYRWSEWLTESRGKLTWDVENRIFVDQR
jgi:hypothetical protein